LFDPTIFDNLKVVIEGEVYDLDLSGNVQVLDRKDIVDLARMSRSYEISFRKAEHCVALKGATLRIHSDLHSLSGELLNNSSTILGCTVEVLFSMEVDNPDVQCTLIENELVKIWGQKRGITQQISYVFGETKVFKNIISLSFNRKINEDQMDDLIEMVSFITVTLDRLNMISRTN
jgi:hypothetical protein